MNRKSSSKIYCLRYALMTMLLPILSFATTPKEKTNISLVLVIIGKDITSAEMEALKKTELPFGLDLQFSLDQQGKLKAVTLHSEGAGDCGLAVDDNNPLPLVLTGEIGGCGSQNFNLKLLEKIQKGQIEESTQVLMGGIPSDPTGLEAYKAKILDLQSNAHQRRMDKLAANNWTEEVENAHDEMRIPLLEDGQKTMTARMKSCLKAGKELQVYINDGAPQSTIPALSELKIKKFLTHWKSKNYYFKGTTQIQKTEWLGLRVEIFTE